MIEHAKPAEPVLELDQIQGIVVPGFFKPHQVLLQVIFPDDRAMLAATCGVLARWHQQHPFSSGNEALEDRDAFRATRAKAGRRRREVAPSHPPASAKTLQREPLSAIAFSAQGLQQLTREVRAIPSLAFLLGLPKRSGLLGDPVSPHNPGAAPNWVVGAPGRELDALIVFAGDAVDQAGARALKLAAQLRNAGAKCEPQYGSVRSDLPGHEHFGFSDGISQPAIRGRRPEAPHNYVSIRHLPEDDPEAARFGYPGQDLVWPGEFVLGYPASSPDPLIPGPARPHAAWTRNGSFLVYRRLRQDVGAFWRMMEAEAARLRSRPAFRGMSADALAAKLVGRWPSGAPLSRAPNGDDGALGADVLANNDFRFDDNTPARHGLLHASLDFPTAKADIVGRVCPVGSHIRKVNVRDQASDAGGSTSTQTRRILRVGVSYGTPVPEDEKFKVKPYGKKVRPEDDRGLLFLSIQASIDDQFEFLQSRWINSASRPRGPGGHDMVAGQNAAVAGGVRRCQLFGTDMRTNKVRATRPFVIPTGGGYFFVPSLTLLEDLLRGARLP